jgi:hypothetical protein
LYLKMDFRFFSRSFLRSPTWVWSLLSCLAYSYRIKANRCDHKPHNEAEKTNLVGFPSVLKT